MTVFCNTLSLEDILGLKNWEILLFFFFGLNLTENVNLELVIGYSYNISHILSAYIAPLSNPSLIHCETLY